MLRVLGQLLHPIAQLRRVNVQVLRRLHIGHASILDQAHGLKLELSRKLPSLHDPPPAPSKHLTRCLRNRVQAIKLKLKATGGYHFCGPGGSFPSRSAPLENKFSYLISTPPSLPPFGLPGVGRRPPRATVCTKPGKGRIFTPVGEPSGKSWLNTSLEPVLQYRLRQLVT